MNVEKNIPVPTGNIMVVSGHKGPLELVSLGDYGKEINLNQNRVVGESLPLMPLTDKWVVTISTQYGCSMGCQFCDVPYVGKGTNCTFHDLCGQVLVGLKLHPHVKYSNRLNIHYARMGEPTFNPHILDHAKWMKDHIDPEYNVHPVVSTMMPKNNEWLRTFIHNWMRIKNRIYHGNAGLQISINSTNEKERQKIFSRSTLTLRQISMMMHGIVPIGRKITLNFAMADWEIDENVLLDWFDPERFLVKLTPIHKTAQATRFGHQTKGDYTTPKPYQEVAHRLRKAGYDVLVFIAGPDEDEGMITCGNAILANLHRPKMREGPLNFQGGSSIGKNPFQPWNLCYE